MPSVKPNMELNLTTLRWWPEPKSRVILSWWATHVLLSLTFCTKGFAQISVWVQILSLQRVFPSNIVHFQVASPCFLYLYNLSQSKIILFASLFVNCLPPLPPHNGKSMRIRLNLRYPCIHRVYNSSKQIVGNNFLLLLAGWMNDDV